MKRSLGLFLLIGAAACAQTEVHRAVVLPSYKDLKFPPLPPVKVPVPETFTLPNGLKVYLLEDHELPVINGVALVRTGNLFDPADKRGLAQMTGDVLRSGGTKAKSGDEIDVQLENIAASVESQVGESSGTISFSALRENADQVLSTFHDFLTSPEFRPEKVELEKTQMRSSISRRNDDANGILDREFEAIVYGRNTPFGWISEYADIDRITRKDMVDFYQRYYFPANVMLAVYGDFSPAEMKDKLTKQFADWTVTQPPVPKFPAVQATPAPGVYLAKKGDVTQTFFSVGHLGGTFRDADYPALEVASEILGGGFSSRLFQRVRTKLGYAYGVSASWGADYDHPGLFTISGSTQSVHTVDTLRVVREELDKIREGQVTAEELQTAKDTVLNGFVFNFDRPSKTLNRVLQYEYYGYPKDFIFQYQKAISAVTQEDVLRVAKKYFRPQDLTIVAVGNPDQFKTPLTALGFEVKTLDLTIPPPAGKEAPKANAATSAQGEQLLKKMQQALGGAEKLAAIKDVVYDAEVAIAAGTQVMKAKQRNAFLNPSTMRQDLELVFGKQTVYYNGSEGWMASAQGSQALPPPIVKQIRGEIFRELDSLALSDRDPNRKVVGTGDNSFQVSTADGDSVTVTLDAAGLPSKLSYQADTRGGPATVEEAFSDWRKVDGVEEPFAATITQAGKKFADVKILDWKINAGLKPEDLSKKP